MAALLALKVDVDTLRGTREGVPPLVELLKRHGAGATFLFTLGPDRTGRAIKRVFRPGFLHKVKRTSVLEHYGLRTLLYGTLLPAPDIGRRAADLMRKVRDEGFEVGVHCWDHVKWQDNVGGADEEWTARELRLACERFTEIFKTPPKTHGAAGWQVNVHALRLSQDLGFDYCSNGRGRAPYRPVWKAELMACPELPTTLPTLDELIGVDGLAADNVAAHVLGLTAPQDGREQGLQPEAQVFTLHAELEGMRMLPVLDELLAGWKQQGYQLVSTGALYATLAPFALPRCEVLTGSVPGRSGTLMVQGPEFLASRELIADAVQAA